MTGTVARIFGTFGFIRPRKRGRSDHYFNISDCALEAFFELTEGDPVVFVSTFDGRGSRAREVQRVSPPPPDPQLTLCETPTLEWRPDPEMFVHKPRLHWRSATERRNRKRA
jgi:cold shock CspA family protein